ncbi:conserved hypothetical protein [uncultured Gammaproteobacteria bacterium]
MSAPLAHAMSAPLARAMSAPFAVVAFTGEADLPWLRLLRPGFRHCFVAVNDGRHWLVIDPLSSGMEVRVAAVGADFDLGTWLTAQGLTVVIAAVRRGLTQPAPWAPFTCVEAVKRVLGLHHRFLITPWQLYRHLVRIAVGTSNAGIYSTISSGLFSGVPSLYPKE